MNTSFYTAARGAMTHQEKLNVISNNIANVNTYGYKAKTSVFQDLLHFNMKAPDTELTDLTAGTGVIQTHTNTDFSQYGFAVTSGEFDYAISGDGFFMLQDTVTGQISYTRAGNFSLSLTPEGFYLISDSGKRVLDQNRNPIMVEDGNLLSEPGIYAFENTDGMESVGNTEFVPLPKNGEPMLMPDTKVVRGYMEMSNVDLGKEISKTIESSRAYSYVLKMMQTSDEIEQTINGLRG